MSQQRNQVEIIISATGQTSRLPESDPWSRDFVWLKQKFTGDKIKIQREWLRAHQQALSLQAMRDFVWMLLYVHRNQKAYMGPGFKGRFPVYRCLDACMLFCWEKSMHLTMLVCFMPFMGVPSTLYSLIVCMKWLCCQNGVSFTPHPGCFRRVEPDFKWRFPVVHILVLLCMHVVFLKKVCEPHSVVVYFILFYVYHAVCCFAWNGFVAEWKLKLSYQACLVSM